MYHIYHAESGIFISNAIGWCNEHTADNTILSIYHIVATTNLPVFLQTFSIAFSLIKMYQFRLRFHCYSFEGLQLTITALVKIMAWGRPGDKPLSEPMMVIWLAHIWVTRPQWVKRHTGNFIAIRIEHIDWLAKHSYNAVANTLELPQSYSKQSIYFCPYLMPDSVICVLSMEWHYYTISMG